MKSLGDNKSALNSNINTKKTDSDDKKMKMNHLKEEKEIILEFLD